MKNLLTGSVFSTLPIYSFISWIILYNNKNLKNHQDRIIEFKKSLFNLDINFKVLDLINIFFIFVAISFFLKCFKNNTNSIYKSVSSIFTIFLMFILIYNVWGIF